MAQRRMFNKAIIDSDRFYSMPFESQILYIHLGMHADAKGFIEPKKIARLAGIKIESIKDLIQNNFVIPFDSGVVVITDWNINNQIRSDREAPTIYTQELALLSENNNKYQLCTDINRTPVELQSNSGSTPAQYSIVESSIVEDSRDERTVEEDKSEDEQNKSTHHPRYSKLSDLDSNELKHELLERFDKRDQLQVISDLEDMKLWLESNGKRKKDYKAFAINWIKKNEAREKFTIKKTAFSKYPIAGEVMGSI